MFFKVFNLWFQLRYRPNAPLVLKGISCTFEEGKRVGIVGRTGSGKTTLITALFRLVEADSGRILIDGFDISSIGLKDLRMKLSVIPQEPTLFKGSIRTNLDPLGLHSDHQIWKVTKSSIYIIFIYFFCIQYAYSNGFPIPGIRQVST